MSVSDPEARRRRRAVAAIAALVLVHLALALDTAAHHSAVFDEVVYPTSGYAYLTAGDYRMNPEHPPLMKLWTALPWLGALGAVEAVPGWVERDQWRFGRALLYGAADPTALLFRARAMVALLSAGLAAGVAWIAFRAAGPVAGVAACALYAFDPLAIAHGSLATTDLGAAAFTFLAAVSYPALVRAPRLRAALASGALTGAALAAKFSTVVLFPVWALAVAVGAVVDRRREGAPSLGRRVAWSAAAVAVALVVLAATYGVASFGAFFDGLRALATHDAVGHPAFAFGLHSDEGWWWFFPAAWLVKTPIVVFAASVAGVVHAFRPASGRYGTLERVVWVATPATLLGVSIVSSLNLGVRHLLPMTPFLAVLGGVAVASLARFGRAGRIAWAAGAVALAAPVLVAHPHHVAYSNVAVGGVDATWRHLADSNVDWGQDLPALARRVAREPLRTLYLGYFGTADPAAHGLVYRSVPTMTMAERRFEDGPDPEGREWIALGATAFRGVYTERKDAYAWLGEPDEVVGGGVLLWDVTGDAAALAALGRSALRFGDARAAVGPLARSAALAPPDDPLRHDLARTFAALGRFDEAVEVLDGQRAPAAHDAELRRRILEAARDAEGQ